MTVSLYVHFSQVINFSSITYRLYIQFYTLNSTIYLPLVGVPLKVSCILSEGQMLVLFHQILLPVCNRYRIIPHLIVHLVFYFPSSKAPTDFVYVDDDDDSASVDDTTRLTTRSTRVILKYFDHCHVRYIWDNERRAFIRLRLVVYCY